MLIIIEPEAGVNCGPFNTPGAHIVKEYRGEEAFLYPLQAEILQYQVTEDIEGTSQFNEVV